jgi:hypothetical protein
MSVNKGIKEMCDRTVAAFKKRLPALAVDLDFS